MAKDSSLLIRLAFQVKGDQDDPGFRGSWSEYKVLKPLKKGLLTVESIEVRGCVCARRNEVLLFYFSQCFA